MKKQLLTKMLLAVALLGVGVTDAWAQEMDRTDGTGLTFFYSGYGNYVVGGSVSLVGNGSSWGTGVYTNTTGRGIQCTLNTALAEGDVIYVYKYGTSSNTITIKNSDGSSTWYTSANGKSGEYTYTVTAEQAGETVFRVYGNTSVYIRNVEVRREGASIDLVDILSSEDTEVVTFENLTGSETYTSNTAVGSKTFVTASESHTATVYTGDVVTSGKNYVNGTACTKALSFPTGAGFLVRLPAGIGKLTLYYDTNSKSGSSNSKYQYDHQNTTGRSTNSMYPGTLSIVNNNSTPRVFYLYVDNTYDRILRLYGYKWEPNFTVPGTITSAGWSTFASEYPLDLSTISGGTAYYASAASGSTVTLTSTTQTVQAGEGIMVKGTAGETFTIGVAASGTAISGNLLKGQTTTGDVAASTDGTYHYVFGFENASKYGFYNLTAATSVAAGKAYLETTSALTSREARLSSVFDDEVTGINDVKGNMSDGRGEYFNLQGQRVDNPKKGLYIVNGMKINMK